MSPNFNRRHAMLVLTKMDEILAWEQKRETEYDNKLVELGQYLCDISVRGICARSVRGSSGRY